MPEISPVFFRDVLANCQWVPLPDVGVSAKFVDEGIAVDHIECTKIFYVFARWANVLVSNNATSIGLITWCYTG